METLVDAVNATGRVLITALEPVPMDLVMIVFLALAVWVWIENLRTFTRKSRQNRHAREVRFVEGSKEG